jgi:predicted GIY-YIG superfamily endonuclease
MFLDRRLRQHRMEIKGGAKATTKKIIEGKEWNRVCYISEFPDWKSALQFEWRWKKISRQISNKTPINKRFIALQRLLILPQSTSKATPFADWSSIPIINFEEHSKKELFNSIFPQHNFLITP